MTGACSWQTPKRSLCLNCFPVHFYPAVRDIFLKCRSDRVILPVKFFHGSPIAPKKALHLSPLPSPVLCWSHSAPHSVPCGTRLCLTAPSSHMPPPHIWRILSRCSSLDQISLFFVSLWKILPLESLHEVSVPSQTHIPCFPITLCAYFHFSS